MIGSESGWIFCGGGSLPKREQELSIRVGSLIDERLEDHGRRRIAVYFARVIGKTGFIKFVGKKSDRVRATDSLVKVNSTAQSALFNVCR